TVTSTRTRLPSSSVSTSSARKSSPYEAPSRPVRRATCPRARETGLPGHPADRGTSSVDHSRSIGAPYHDSESRPSARGYSGGYSERRRRFSRQEPERTARSFVLMTGIHPASYTSPRLRPETPLYRSRDRRAWTNRNGRSQGSAARGTVKRTLGGAFDGQGSCNRSGVGPGGGHGWRPEECEVA